MTAKSEISEFARDGPALKKGKPPSWQKGDLQIFAN
jgi:hypothetical protein